MIDTATYEVQKIDPTPGRLTHPLTFRYDRLTGHLYATDYYLDTVYEIDPVANAVVRTLHVPAGDVPHFTRVKVHAVGVNSSLARFMFRLRALRARMRAFRCSIRVPASLSGLYGTG